MTSMVIVPMTLAASISSLSMLRRRPTSSSAQAACVRCPCAGPPTPGSSIALDLNPVFYLRVARLAQHLAPHLRLDVAFPLLIGHTKHLRPKRAAFGADVWI